MEEKKMNDDTEMNVGMLEDALIDTLKEVTIKFSKDSYICRILTDTIHLINRQKEEISLLKKQPITPSVFDLSTENGLLKAEIERLTKERDGYLDDRFAVCHALRQAIKENDELQKQVDELKERYLEESKERCEFEQRYKKIQHAHNIGLGTQRKHWEKKVQQAVKDTAKEIFDELYKASFYKQFIKREYRMVELDKLKKLEERYGVEVE